MYFSWHCTTCAYITSSFIY